MMKMKAESFVVGGKKFQSIIIDYISTGWRHEFHVGDAYVGKFVRGLCEGTLRSEDGGCKLKFN